MWARFDTNGNAAWFGPEAISGAEWVEGATHDMLVSMRRVNGAWVEREPAKVEPPTAAEVAAQAAAENEAREEAEAERRKVEGFAFEGVMCSATRDDQNGLTAVLMAIQLQGEDFVPTRFEFSNGSKLVIGLGNYRAFMAQWMPFRQSFFRVEG